MKFMKFMEFVKFCCSYAFAAYRANSSSSDSVVAVQNEMLRAEKEEGERREEAKRVDKDGYLNKSWLPPCEC